MPEKARSVSIIIPAFNEEKILGETLDSIFDSANRCDADCELIVVDHASTDGTTDIAKSKGARVTEEQSQGNISRVRNTGAKAATGEILVFVDADVSWPPEVLPRIFEEMKSGNCRGGALDTDYRSKRFLNRTYVRFWRVFGRLFGMAQGATQFCDAETFRALGGYDEAVFMGEDVEFFWRLCRAAKKSGGSVKRIDDVRVIPSCRKIDQWPFWKTLLLTNPLICLIFSRLRKPWGGWYKTPTR
ncbi:MAG: glycosyltransferase [Verrucomicrobiales bacterium]|nr:glycosyltransferase [Verrucomicrobiales bacterium]